MKDRIKEVVDSLLNEEVEIVPGMLGVFAYRASDDANLEPLNDYFDSHEIEAAKEYAHVVINDLKSQGIDGYVEIWVADKGGGFANWGSPIYSAE